MMDFSQLYAPDPAGGRGVSFFEDVADQACWGMGQMTCNRHYRNRLESSFNAKKKSE
jgi:hypothetical protein